MRPPSGITLAALLSLTAPVARTQVPEAVAPTAPAYTLPDPAAKRAVAVRVRPGAIVLDGRIDDAAWSQARPIGDFVMKDPVEGAPPTDSMTVRIAYDDDALWVGARMFAKDLSSIQAPVGRRDNIGQIEHLIISLDTYRDRRTAYSFAVTASGVRGDWFHPGDDEYVTDGTFEPVWEARAAMDSLGWTAEMRIPFNQLRFVGTGAQEWGLNIDRWVPSRQEDVFWVPVPKNVSAWSSRMGVLVGIEGIRPSRRLELLPYAASAATFNGLRDRRDPFDDGRNLEARFGGDLKMGLGPSLTLEATVNPDFGQVEADPAEINLTGYETFFSERRPFFLEGSQLFGAGGNSYFYSRRIGGPPPGTIPSSLDYDFADFPSNSTILGAAKISGRLASGTSLGVLAALTDREHVETVRLARVDTTFAADGETVVDIDTLSRRADRALVAPRTGYAVLAGQQEFGRNSSTINGIVTAVRRDVELGDAIAQRVPREAYSGGTAWNLRFRGGEYRLDGNLGFSHVAGDTLAIARQQRSTRRYYQRPDADYVDYDPSRTSLAGTTGSLQLRRASGRHWLWTVNGAWETPGFEINDIGAINAADSKSAFAQLRYRETRPRSFYRSWFISSQVENQWDFGDALLFRAYRGDANLTFRNNWTLDATAWQDQPALDYRMTRGGPYIRKPRANVGIVRLGNSFAASTRWWGRVYYGRDEYGGTQNRLSGSVSVRPTTQWQLTLEPNYLRYDYTRQFAAAIAGGPEATFGTTYVFGYLQQNEFRLPLRLNYTFRPDLTLELYAEPFAASGRYRRFGALRAARSGVLDVYPDEAVRTDAAGHRILVAAGDTIARSCGIDCFDDYTVRSLYSNMVLRWEWRRGSTLFLVWQQSRASAIDRIREVRPFDAFDAFSASGSNFIALKMNWWIPVD